MRPIRAWALCKKGGWLACKGYSNISIFPIRGAACDANTLKYKDKAKLVEVEIREVKK